MDIPGDWMEHRRGDGELIGWIVPEGEDFATIDLLGRRSAAVDWLTAEERLDETGIGYLAEHWAYWVTPEKWVRVELVEVSPNAIRVEENDYDDAVEELATYTLSFPVGPELVPLSEVGG